ncbi:MAG: hypothetical protein IT364_18570 [Candidatus Hydrogenedentes bacterium]|nr:hypothetical protein [Candidatus Hydrogenedentota bacterium]
MALLFDDNDDRYLQWLTQNPGGLVVNCRRTPSSEYMVLHTATCPHISKIRRNQRAGGFTEKSYVKLCGTSEDDLRKAIREFDAQDFSKVCRCMATKNRF